MKWWSISKSVRNVLVSQIKYHPTKSISRSRSYLRWSDTVVQFLFLWYCYSCCNCCSISVSRATGTVLKKSRLSWINEVALLLIVDVLSVFFFCHSIRHFDCHAMVNVISILNNTIVINYVAARYYRSEPKMSNRNWINNMEVNRRSHHHLYSKKTSGEVTICFTK